MDADSSNRLLGGNARSKAQEKLESLEARATEIEPPTVPKGAITEQLMKIPDSMKLSLEHEAHRLSEGVERQPIRKS